MWVPAVSHKRPVAPVDRVKMGHKAYEQACEKEEGPAARGKRKKQKKAANPIISSIFAAPSSLLPARAGWGVRILITKKTMTEESSDALSADRGGKQLPKGIHIVETDPLMASKEKVVPRRPLAETWGSTSEKPTSWSYLYLRHFAVKTFKKWLEHYNEQTEGRPQPFFIHQSYHYEYKNPEKQRGVRKVLQPSISGLVFLQGTVRDLQAFLDEHFPQFHLVNDRSRGCPASIEDAIMRPFMNVSRIHPERLTFLREPLEKFAKDHVRLRVLTGPFQGYEGYIVRIQRNRQLVFDFGGCALAISGVHNEDFEVVEE